MNSSRVVACALRNEQAVRAHRPTDSVLANSKTQNAFLFTVNAIFRHDYPLAVEPGSTPRPLVQKKLGRILYLLICSFLPCLSWLLSSRVRKSRRDLWITLYLYKQLYPNLTQWYTNMYHMFVYHFIESYCSCWCIYAVKFWICWPVHSVYHQAVDTMNGHRTFFNQLVRSLRRTADDLLAEIPEAVTTVDVDVLRSV